MRLSLKRKNPAAVALGRLTRGKPKIITEQDRLRRRLWALGVAEERRAARAAREQREKAANGNHD